MSSMLFEITAQPVLSDVRLRARCSRFDGGTYMDMNYLLDREQHALHLAETSSSSCARVAHRAFAKAYGLLIAGTDFPHSDSSARGREPPMQSPALSGEAQIRDWESEGGSIWTKPDRLLQRNSRNVAATRRPAEAIALARGRILIFP
jgi:hypothetical protein